MTSSFGNFGGRTTGVGGSSRPCQPQYSLPISVDRTKVMASDGIACRILIQNEQLAQVNTFPYVGSLIKEDGECTTEFCTRLSKGQAIGTSLQKIWKSHSIPISTKIRLTRMWANAQRDGRPVEYRWRPLFNAAKFG